MINLGIEQFIEHCIKNAIALFSSEMTCAGVFPSPHLIP